MKRFVIAVALSVTLLSAASGNETTIKESKRIVSRHKNVFTKAPERTPHKERADGPLLGNGDMGVVIGGSAKHLRFYLHKNDMWRLQHGYGNACPVVFGNLGLDINGLEKAPYSILQDLYTGTTKGNFKVEGGAVAVTAYVSATENLCVIELTAEGKAFQVRVNLGAAGGRGSQQRGGKKDNVYWKSRAFEKNVDIPSGCSAAWKYLGAKESTGKLTLNPGKPVTIVVGMDSLFRSKNYVTDVQSSVAAVDSKKLATVRAAHLEWWANFWAKSYVEINDPVIEHHYYRSLYGMGSCSRNMDFPPALFGWVTTSHPEWHGDYHLNYNHHAPFYGLARANRIEQVDPHITPVLDFMERAQWHCKEIFGYEGVMYPVGIGPKGISTTYAAERYMKRGPRFVQNKGLFYGQRSNGAYALVNVAQRWYSTYDKEYGKKVYPLVFQVARFWENYVKWDAPNSRFVIDKDSMHEGSGNDLNACLSLGLVSNALQLAIDMSTELKVDEKRRKQWTHIVKNLAEYPTWQRDGKTVFRYTEKGLAWFKNNTVGIQHIYPAGQIHLDSDPRVLQVARNTLEVMGRWRDYNGTNSFFPSAVRVGYDAETILIKLREYAKNTFPNGFLADNPHSIENLSTTHNTINEMLCMGHKGVIRLFPVWPKTKDASFTNIRCWGAFLVSAEKKGDTIRNIAIRSERGRKCTVVNPWPGKAVQLKRNGKHAETLKGKRITFATAQGETIELIQRAR